MFFSVEAVVHDQFTAKIMFTVISLYTVKAYNSFHFQFMIILCENQAWGGGGTPFNGLYREAPSERGTVIRLQASGTCLQIGEILQECLS